MLEIKSKEDADLIIEALNAQIRYYDDYIETKGQVATLRDYRTQIKEIYHNLPSQ
jgi:hypothetical protein